MLYNCVCNSHAANCTSDKLHI